MSLDLQIELLITSMVLMENDPSFFIHVLDKSQPEALKASPLESTAGVCRELKQQRVLLQNKEPCNLMRERMKHFEDQ